MDRKKVAMLRNILATRASFDVVPKIPSLRYRGQDERLPSFDSGEGVASKKDPLMYTGTRLKGIATMHKSNMVPVFSDDEAVDLAKMRR